MKNILTIFITLAFPILLFSQEGKTKLTATDLLQMQESQAFNAIGKRHKSNSKRFVFLIKIGLVRKVANILPKLNPYYDGSTFNCVFRGSSFLIPFPERHINTQPGYEVKTAAALVFK